MPIIFSIIVLCTFGEAYPQSLEYRNSLFWTRLRDIDLSGNHAFCAFHNGLAIFDISDPDTVAYASRVDLQGETQFLFVHGDYAYLSDRIRGLNIVDISDIGNPELVYSQSDTFQSKGLYVQNNYCYLAKYPSGAGDKFVEIIDVTDPVNPVHNSNLDFENSIPVLVFAAGNYIYITTGGGDTGTLHIADISDPFNPFLLSYCYTIHQIGGLYVEENYAYLATGSSFGSRFDIVDCTDPSAPYIIGSINPGGWDPAFVDVYMAGNYAFATLGTQGLGVINVVDRQNPYIDTIIGIDGGAGTLDIDNGIACAGKYYEGFTAIDVTDTLNPVLRGSYSTNNTITAVCVRDDYLYMASRNEILIADNTGRINPIIVNTYNANDYIWRLYRSGNCLFVIQYRNMAYMLHIYDIIDPANPVHLGEYSPSSNPTDVFIAGNYAYVSTINSGLLIIDFSDPSSPLLAGAYDGHARIGDVYVQGNYAYLTNNDDGLIIVNVSNPCLPFFMGNYLPSFGSYFDVTTKDEYAYLTSPQGLTILNIADPVNISQISITPLPQSGHELFYYDNYLFISNQVEGLIVCDISDRINPQIITDYDTPGRAFDFVILEDYVYIADEFSLLILFFNRQTELYGQCDIIASRFSLAQSYPNPFNATTTIEFSLPVAAEVELSIYNILGQKIAVLFDGRKPAGKHAITWDASVAPSGIYFAQLESGGNSRAMKMLLLK